MNYAVFAAIPFFAGAGYLGYASVSEAVDVQPTDKLQLAFIEYQQATAEIPEADKNFNEIWTQKIASDGLTAAELAQLVNKAKATSKERFISNENRRERRNFERIDVNKNGIVSKQEYEQSISKYEIDFKTGKKIKLAEHIFERVYGSVMGDFGIWDEDRDGNLDASEQAQFTAHEQKIMIKATQIDSAEVQSYLNLMSALIEKEPSGDKSLSRAEFDVLMSELKE